VIAANRPTESGLGIAADAPVVREIYAISRFDTIITAFDSVRDALAKLDPAALDHLAVPDEGRFLGTAGRCPAPLSAAAVREKLMVALIRARARSRHARGGRAFVEGELKLSPTPSTFGGNTSCIQIDTGRADYLLCDMGSGARESPWAVAIARAIEARGSPATYHVLMSTCSGSRDQWFFRFSRRRTTGKPIDGSPSSSRRRPQHARAVLPDRSALRATPARANSRRTEPMSHSR